MLLRWRRRPPAPLPCSRAECLVPRGWVSRARPRWNYSPEPAAAAGSAASRLSQAGTGSETYFAMCPRRARAAEPPRGVGGNQGSIPGGHRGGGRDRGWEVNGGGRRKDEGVDPQRRPGGRTPAQGAAGVMQEGAWRHPSQLGLALDSRDPRTRPTWACGRLAAPGDGPGGGERQNAPDRRPPGQGKAGGQAEPPPDPQGPGPSTAHIPWGCPATPWLPSRPCAGLATQLALRVVALLCLLARFCSSLFPPFPLCLPGPRPPDASPALPLFADTRSLRGHSRCGPTSLLEGRSRSTVPVLGPEGAGGSWGSGRKGAGSWQRRFGRTGGGGRLERRRGGSWRWQLDGQLGLGRGAGREDSWGGAAVGLAGSPRPRATLEGGLGEARRGSRASWPQRLSPEQGWVVLGCSRPSRRAGPGATCGGRVLRPGQVRLPAGAWRGQGQALGRPLGGGRMPRAVAMGTAEQHRWLENKQTSSLTSDCYEVSSENAAGGGRGAGAACREGAAEGPGRGCTGHWGGGAKGHLRPLLSPPKLLLGSASEPTCRERTLPASLPS